MLLTRTAAALVALLLVSCTQKNNGSPEIAITGAWSRATVAGQSSAAAYLTITNNGDADERLLKVSTPIGQSSLHSTSMENGVMRMRPINVLVIPAHSSVELKSGGMHIMIMGVKQPLQAGSAFPLTLDFDRSGIRNVIVTVRPATDGGAM